MGYWFSGTLRLGTGLNTLHSYVRYLLLMRYTLPDFTVTVGPVSRTIISLQVGSPRMTVGGVAKTIDVQLVGWASPPGASRSCMVGKGQLWTE
jgi:hypothetical protein